MSSIFHRHLHTEYPLATKGDRCHIIDSNGKRYFDAGDAAVSCLGHSNDAANNAIKDQLNNIAFAHSGFFTNQPMEELADYLTRKAPGNLSKTYFVSGGSEAIEASLKMARQYFLEIGQPQRKHFIARKQSYHGNTLGALAIGGNAWRRQQFEPLLVSFEHISPCYEYRNKHTEESIEDYSLRSANELEQMILELGAENVIGFLAEPVVGATSGALTATKGYFKRIREICDEYGILLILDEVMCGMGRTGYLYAHEYDNIEADLVTIAKSLGGGYQPIGATLVHDKIYQAIHQGSGFFQHGHTYMGHSIACAASLAVQKYIESNNILDNVKLKGELLKQQLIDQLGEHPHVGDIRGRGLFLALELVADKETKQTFSPGDKIHARIKKQAMDNGLICYPMGGTIDGVNGDHILLAPPFIINDNDIDEITTKLKKSIMSSIA